MTENPKKETGKFFKNLKEKNTSKKMPKNRCKTYKNV